jgi:membrane peptidoglycan carboxypeptidase
MAWSVARAWLAERPGAQNPRALERSVQGLALSVWLSRHWSAEQLLTARAEQAFFGRGLKGLDAAAWRYFGKPPEQLALHEVALLAGLPSAPSRFDPFCRPEQALRRRAWVLARLQALEWISEAEREAAQGQPLLPTPIGMEEVTCGRSP